MRAPPRRARSLPPGLRRHPAPVPLRRVRARPDVQPAPRRPRPLLLPDCPGQSRTDAAVRPVRGDRYRVAPLGSHGSVLRRRGLARRSPVPGVSSTLARDDEDGPTMGVVSLPRQCIERGCSGKTLQGSRCPRHAPAWKGGQPAASYGSGWARLRARVLAEEPRCACGAASTEVDHIVALAFGGTHDRRNLRGVCAACHKQKTAADSRLGKARKARGLFFRSTPGERTSPATRSAAVRGRNVGGR